MAKLTLLNLPSPDVDAQGFVDAYNANLTSIENAFAKTLSRDGSAPNLIDTEIYFGGVDIVNGPVISPDIYVTSRPYPLINSDGFDLRTTMRTGFMDIGLITDQGYLDLGMTLRTASLQITVGYIEYSYGPSLFDPEELDLSMDLRSGSLEITVGYVSYAWGSEHFDPEKIDISMDLRSGLLQIVADYIDYTNWTPEGFDLSATLTSGSLA